MAHRYVPRPRSVQSPAVTAVVPARHRGHQARIGLGGLVQWLRQSVGGGRGGEPAEAAATAVLKGDPDGGSQYRVIPVPPDSVPIAMCGARAGSAQRRSRRMASPGTDTHPAVAPSPLTCRKMPAPRPRTGRS